MISKYFVIVVLTILVLTGIVLGRYDVDSEFIQRLIEDPRTSDQLIQDLDNQDFMVREEAAEILGYRNATGVVEALIKTSENDSNSSVRTEAVYALSRINCTIAVEPLIKL